MANPTSGFARLGIRPELVRLLQQQGVAIPTAVQERAIPPLMAGQNVTVQAQTGTGKTLAFVLPILQRIDPDAPHVQALIVAPTRELALQIATETNRLAKGVGAIVLAAYGGQDVEGQIRKLQGAAHIVVGTPGRLLDHLRRGTLRLSQISMLVIDEADQMLDMGFLPEVEEIIRELPTARQTMLFSATFPDTVRRLASRYMQQPMDIRVDREKIPLDSIRQIVVETTDRAKQATLIKLIETYHPFLAVVFCRTKIRAKKLADALLAHGMNVDELHGDLTQAKREQVMERFRKARIQILVATDVAARGLDVEGITHVFNYDIPHDAESYIHRIGRTGRAGNKGLALTFVTPRDRQYLQLIEREIGVSLARMPAGEEETGDYSRTGAQNKGRGSRAAGRGQRHPDRPSGETMDARGDRRRPGERSLSGSAKVRTDHSRTDRRAGSSRSTQRDTAAAVRGAARPRAADEQGKQRRSGGSGQAAGAFRSPSPSRRGASGKAAGSSRRTAAGRGPAGRRGRNR